MVELDHKEETMNNFSRSELKLILEGLDSVRNRLREEIMGGPGYVTEDSEYNALVRLQDRIIDAMESRFY
jgi:hypothetical protein